MPGLCCLVHAPSFWAQWPIGGVGNGELSVIFLDRDRSVSFLSSVGCWFLFQEAGEGVLQEAALHSELRNYALQSEHSWMQ